MEKHWKSPEQILKHMETYTEQYGNIQKQIEKYRKIQKSIKQIEKYRKIQKTIKIYRNIWNV